MTDNTKGFRAVVKQIAGRARSYSLSYYVREAKKNGHDVSKTDIVSAIKRISRQTWWSGLTIRDGRVYNYTLAA